jgi:hypothetical protein
MLSLDMGLQAFDARFLVRVEVCVGESSERDKSGEDLEVVSRVFCRLNRAGCQRGNARGCLQGTGEMPRAMLAGVSRC